VVLVRPRLQQQQQQQQHTLNNARKQLHIAPHTPVRFNGVDWVEFISDLDVSIVTSNVAVTTSHV
jgi:hypothetical protein